MMATVRVLKVTLTVLFVAYFVPCWHTQPGGGLLPLQTEALAATGSDFSGQSYAPGDNSVSDVQPYTPAQHVPDPLEPFNRVMFKVNNDLYFYAMKPFAKGYATVVPPGVRTCIDNGFSNAMTPIYIVNSLLQGKVKTTGIEMARLIINSTMGFGGLFDIAKTHFNLRSRNEDTGQTLGVYGMKPIIYLYWPALGPSDLRDSIGTAADVFMIPFYYFTPGIISSLVISGAGIENRLSLHLGEYESFLNAAIDPYAAARDAYLQHRAELIKK